MDRLESVRSRLTDALPALSAQVADIVHSEQPSYAAVTDRELGLAVQRNLATAIRCLGHPGDESEEDLSEIALTVRERFHANIPMHEAIRAFSLCIWQIHRAFLGICMAEDIPYPDVAAGSNALWQLGDAIIETVTTTYCELQSQQMIKDAQQRSEFVRRLLRGNCSADELRRTSLNDKVRYAAVHCTSEHGFTTAGREQLEAAGSLSEAPAMLATVDADCVGVMARRPLTGDDALVAMGPMVPLSQIARSFALANRINHVATHAGLTGVHGLGGLSWRVAAVDHPELIALLRRRFVDPLRTEPAMRADLEATMRSYLDHNMNMAATAADLHVHVNTLRYRLGRFAEITGANLDHLDDMVDIVWAFELGDLDSLRPCL